MNRHGNNRVRLASPAGFSTVGALVSLVLAGLVLSQMLGMVVHSQRGLIDSNAKAKAAGSARHAYLVLSRLLRQAGSDPQGVGVQGIAPDPLGRGRFDNIRLRADFNPPDGDLADPGEDLTLWLNADTLFVTETAGGAGAPYLFGVDSLAFDYYDRAGSLITDPDSVPSQTVSVGLTVRGFSEVRDEQPRQLLVGRIALRNGG